MADESDSDYSGLIMGLVLVIFLAVGLVSWAAAGTSNSSTNPQITVPPATPCSTVAASYSTLNNTLQSYAFGTATIEQVNAARREFAAVLTRELHALAPNVREALGPVQDELQATQEVIAQPNATNREIADQTQKVAAAASAVPTLCHDSFSD
jgi:endonuclease/exonuclease/phosphatase (EEP) superfamily protein YafD